MLRSDFFGWLTGLTLLLLALTEPAIAEQNAALATQQDDAATTLAEAVSLEGSDTTRSLELARQALQLTRRQPEHPLELAALLQTAKVTRLLNDYEETGALVNEGLALAAAANNERMRGELLLVLGTAEWNQGKLPEATAHLTESLGIAERCEDKRLLFNVEMRLGVLRGRYDDPPGELDHLQTALGIAEELRDPVCMAAAFNALGNHFSHTREYPTARSYFERALQIVQDGADWRMTAYLLINLGEIATNTGDQEAARRYLEKAMALCQRCNSPRGIADAHYLLAAVDRRTGNIEAADRHLHNALALAENIKNPDLLASVYEESIRLEEIRGDYRAAADYERKLEEQRQILRNETSRRLAQEIGSKYEGEARLRRIKLLQRDKDLQKAALALANSELIRTRTEYTALAAGLGLGLVILIARWRFHVLASRRNLAQTRFAKERAEEGLRESENRFRNAFEYSALGFALVGLQGQWLRVNQAICDVVGYTPEELLATTFQAITHPDDLSADLGLIEQLLAGQINSYHLEKRYFHKDGHLVWIWLDVSLVRGDHGEPRYFISQVQDISARKQTAEALQAAKDEAERANNAKSEFLSRTSHELRTPLNAILGFSQLLEHEDLTPRQHKSVEHVITAGRHLLGLINDVLDMAKIENETVTLETVPVPVALAVREALDLVRPLAAQVGVVIRPLSDEAEKCVSADPRRLRQILLNLFSNAIKFNRPGGEMGVAWRESGDGSRVCVDVSDTGVGMAGEDWDRIFTPFTRLPASEKLEGTGLGLPLARSLAESMGGALGVWSALGQGSVFTLELPAEVSSGELPADLLTSPEMPLAARDAAGREDASMLYIEDNPANLQLIESLLQDHRPEVRLISAVRGRQGVELAREHRPDVILLDLHLPDIDGVEVLRALHSQSETAEVPVIVLSADATPAQIRRLRTLGACGYLTKPFVVGELLRALDESLQARETPAIFKA